MAIRHSIGQPVNESERQAIAYFEHNLPDTYHLFHNLELPSPHGLPYEYDQIIVGDHAVYVIEVKNRHGCIKGNAKNWELESGAIDKSPIPISNTKARVLADLLHKKPALQKVWVQSLIVLTDNRACVMLNDPQANRVLHLEEAVAFMLDITRLPVRATPHAYLTDLICTTVFNQFDPLRRPNEIGDYCILETIGKNDRYTTLLAEHRLIRTRNRFTLKVYHINIFSSPETRRKQEEWTLRDATALYMLAGHPNIVKAYQPFPWEDNKIILPVEWIDGYSLRGLLDTHITISYMHTLEIMQAICEGLRYAHSNGVIHRDLRPDNIIIPNDGLVKLVNFDCSRVKDLRTIGSQVSRVLDERYIVPEIEQGAHTASPATDLYAAGIVMFELLTGQQPYQKLKEIKTAGGLPHRPTEINPQLPPDVDEVMARLCAYNAQARYSSAAEVIYDLKYLAETA